MTGISTIWIQVLTYIASAFGALLSGFLTSHFIDIPPTVVVGVAGGIGYFLHHYLDGLLNTHVDAVNTAVQQASINASATATLLPAPVVIGDAQGSPQGVTINAANVHVGGPVARSATGDDAASATTAAGVSSTAGSLSAGTGILIPTSLNEPAPGLTTVAVA